MYSLPCSLWNLYLGPPYLTLRETKDFHFQPGKIRWQQLTYPEHSWCIASVPQPRVAKVSTKILCQVKVAEEFFSSFLYL
jgi:hypothetical protein